LSGELGSGREFTAAEIEQALRTVAERHDLKGSTLIHPVRLAVTGVSVGPGLFELLELLGRETVLRRLELAIGRVPKILGIG